MPSPSHVVQRRAGFSFRLTVPADLRPIVGLREVVRSLKAPTRRVALAMSRRAALRGRMAFRMLRRMAETKTLDLRDYRAWLLEQIEAELDAFDRRTASMNAAEREAWDAATDVDVDAAAQAMEPPPRPLPESDALAREILGRHGLSLDALDPEDQQVARIEALAAWADLLILKSESATDQTRSFPTRADVLAGRRGNLAGRSGGAQAGPLSIVAMRQMQGLDIQAGKLRISELFGKYCEAKRGQWKDWENRVRREYLPIQNSMIGLLGDLPLEELNVGHIRSFADRVKADAEARGLKPATVDKVLTLTGGMLRWAKQQAMLADLTGPLAFDSEYDHYEAFTPDELRTMFQCEGYLQGTFARSADFWLPLLGFFTGARINELASAKVEQVMQEDGAWGLLLSPGGKKTGKNVQSRRFVPLHSALLAAGFLDYRDALLREGREDLFPDLPNDARDGKGRSASRDFQTFRRRLGLGAAKGEGRGSKTFHSFRATLATALQNAGFTGDVPRAITGHAATDVHGRVYAQGAVPLAMRQQAVEAIAVPFEVPRWRDSPAQQYARAHGRKQKQPGGSKKVGGGQ